MSKGINPIFASLILIACTIAVGVAIAGLVFGIFETYDPGIVGNESNYEKYNAFCIANGFKRVAIDNMAYGIVGVRYETKTIDNIDYVYCYRESIKEGIHYEEYRWVELG